MATYEGNTFKTAMRMLAMKHLMRARYRKLAPWRKVGPKKAIWDHGGSVTLVVVGSDGTEERYEIEVGQL